MVDEGLWFLADTCEYCYDWNTKSIPVSCSKNKRGFTGEELKAIKEGSTLSPCWCPFYLKEAEW